MIDILQTLYIGPPVKFSRLGPSDLQIHLYHTDEAMYKAQVRYCAEIKL